jgi:hypothetical protein
VNTITLHLTSNQLCSQVTLHLDGEDYTADFHGDGHQGRARTLAVFVRSALKTSKAAALNLIA